VRVVAGGRRTALFERTLEPQKKLEDRGWFELDLPLDAFAGRDVTLELATATDSDAGETPLIAGFAEPRLIGKPRSGAQRAEGERSSEGVAE
jgi:hypothetical protein